MKKKSRQSYHSMKRDELTKALTDVQKKLASWRVSRYSKQSKNVREGRGYVRTIAIIKTVLNLKELQHE